ncbi:hypothetical protein HQQ81_12770 [Microbacteriaceae bacterium VKM Ac-2854]|nr:hypothetical protein [Microbacteriaceae bacterium VKM Ac-2854]
MGTSKRYADSISRAIDARIVERFEASALRSLSPQERFEREHPAARARIPVPVRATVLWGEQPVSVEGHAIAWSDVAVHVCWSVEAGTGESAWVWASDTRRR